MGALSAAAERRREESLIDRILRGIGAGAGSGLTFNWNDEAGMADAEQLRAAHDEAPLSYAAGEVLGAAPVALAGGGLLKAMLQHASPRARFLGAALFGAGHGALAGSGGFTPGPMSEGDHWRDAGIGALLGGAVGAGGVSATRAVRDVGRNIPAITGREALADGGFRSVAPFTGTRTGAPLTVSLSGTGSADDRARQALMSALSQDEAAMVRETGKAKLGRFANDGRDLRAFGSDTLPQSVSALRSYGAQSPGGQAVVGDMANDLIEKSVRTQMKNMRAPAPTGLLTRARIAKQEADDFVATMDNPQFHASWVAEARKLGDGEKASLAVRVVRELRSKAKRATGTEAEAFKRYLSDKTISDKLKVLGVNVGNLRGARKSGQEIEKEVERLRALAKKPNNASYAFRNWDDKDLASQGDLNAADAQALLRAMMAPQRAFAVHPDSAARVLSGQYERGVRFDPRDWFSGVDAADLEGSVRFAQPAAAALPGLLGLSGGNRR